MFNECNKNNKINKPKIVKYYSFAARDTLKSHFEFWNNCRHWIQAKNSLSSRILSLIWIFQLHFMNVKLSVGVLHSVWLGNNGVHTYIYLSVYGIAICIAIYLGVYVWASDNWFFIRFFDHSPYGGLMSHIIGFLGQLMTGVLMWFATI